MRALVTVDIEEDLEDFEDDARPWLARLGAVVDLLYVPPPVARPTANTELAVLLEGAVQRQDEEHRARLRQVLANLAPPERAGQVLVIRDASPAAAIVGSAPDHDLLVVGTHGRGGVARAWLGSVAERVVRTSPVPVLVIHGPGPKPAAQPPHRVLVAVDVAEPEAVLAGIVAWAERLSLVADALHVRAPVPPLSLDDVWGTAWGDVEREIQVAARNELVRRVEAWPEAVRGDARVEVGDPAEVLVAEAAKGYAAVLVGTHGRQGVGRLWLGSVAERVVRRSPVPVLVVPTH